MATMLRQSIIERLVQYSVLFQKSAYVVRVDPNRKALFIEAVRQWETGPTAYLPPVGDQAKRAEFIAICNEICGSQPEPTNTLGYVFKPLNGAKKTNALQVSSRSCSLQMLQ